MYEQIKSNWKPFYLYGSVGLTAGNEYVDDETVEELFVTEFLKPVKKFIGSEVDPEPKQIAAIISKLNSLGLKCQYHVLNTVAYEYFTKGRDTEDTLSKSVEKFLKSATPVYAMCMGGKTFATYTVKDKLVGKYNTKVCVLGDCSKFKKYVPEMKDLIHKNPISLPDPTIQAIKNAVEAEFVSETALNSIFWYMPDYATGRVITRKVRATDKDLPSYFVRKLITSLPDATIEEATSPYHAAYEYASKHPEDYRAVLRELDEILNKLGDDTLKMSPEKVEELSNGVDISGLNRDNVIEWLHVTYGIAYDNLSAILIPTAEKVYSSPLLAENNLDDMTGRELAEQLDESATGHIDDIVRAYCNEIGMSTECTIEQLFESVEEGGVKKDPLSIFDLVADYVVEHDLPNELTIEEFCTQTPHSIEGQKDAVVSYLNAITVIPEDIKTKLVNTINGVGDMSDVIVKKPLEFADVVDAMVQQGCNRAVAKYFLENKGMLEPEPMVIESLVAKVKDDPAKLKDLTATCLTNLGFTTEEAIKLTNHEIPVNDESFNKALSELYSLDRDRLNEAVKLFNMPMSRLANYALKNLGYSDELMQEITAGTLSKPEAPAVSNARSGNITTDFGYRVGEQILFETRDALMRNDTHEKHMELTPIMACFMRLLLCRRDDKDGVIGTIERKIPDAKGEALQIIQHALSELRV